MLLFLAPRKAAEKNRRACSIILKIGLIVAGDPNSLRSPLLSQGQAGSPPRHPWWEALLFASILLRFHRKARKDP
ncbi:MAG: hypothetical protein PHY34_03470 [Patescibacteria group bacterium]|nr:hypothetical protein [Patescibacteria group bacterium]